MTEDMVKVSLHLEVQPGEVLPWLYFSSQECAHPRGLSPASSCKLPSLSIVSIGVKDRSVPLPLHFMTDLTRPENDAGTRPLNPQTHTLCCSHYPVRGL